MGMGLGIGLGRTIGGNNRSWTTRWANEDWGNYDVKITPVYLSADTLIKSTDPTFNYGANTTIVAGELNNAVDNVYRTLINFNINSVPEITPLGTVSINLYKQTDFSSNTRKIQVFRMKRAWAEGTGKGSATGNGATWNTYNGVDNWTSSGGFDPADCEQTPIGEASIADGFSSGWVKIPLNISNKADITLGYGLMIKMETELNDCHVFASRTGTVGRRPYLEVRSQEIINGTFSPLLTKTSSPLFAGVFGSIVYEGLNNYSFYYCKVGGSGIFKRTSVDGLAWGEESTILTSVGSAVEVAQAWKEGVNHYMLYRSNEYTANKDICLATSPDGTTWTRSLSNPVITQADIGAWASGDIDPWGIIKIGSTYYLFINNVQEIPRQTGLCTSTDLINWTMNANNPLFDNGRYCVQPIKYKDKYYLFVCYTPEGNIIGADPLKYRIELYRDALGTFLPANREFLGNILLGGEDGEWDDDYLDTPSILTTTIERDVYPAGSDKDGRLWMYYTGQGAIWGHGLAIGHLEMLDKLTPIPEPEAGT